MNPGSREAGVLKVVRRPVVRRDLISIYRHIAADSPRAARTVLEDIERKIQGLATFPDMGRVVALPKRTVRIQPAGNYLIVYTARRDSLELLRILHGARDWMSLLED
ncbi:type II toxin-antitoxin system RelE/ParE family toxin [Maricaulis sp. MIT060901]|uniref:type II toxin-antitoxin system RelE/ParE family toxin n=1 Tax=Maricaulis sp. MIT060901 TaxID=3096993 RepID=UPI00399B43AE